MSEQIKRTIDDSGRISLPGIILEKLGWKINDIIELTALNGTLLLERIAEYEEPLCSVCGEAVGNIRLKGIDYCTVCVEEVEGT